MVSTNSPFFAPLAKDLNRSEDFIPIEVFGFQARADKLQDFDD